MKDVMNAEKICVLRDGKHILRDVSLQIGAHDFTTIIGPNGAGKSTLLKCMMGLIEPDSGTVLRRANLRVGYVPQRISPDHTMPITVKRFLRLRKSSELEEYTQVVEETQIEAVLEKPLHILSGGEMQRVLLARALLSRPELLVLDEPAQNLDVTGQLAFYKLLEQIYNVRKVSIVMVSHDLHLVMSCTKQVVCLFHHVCCSGEPHMVTKDPEFKALFGDDMAQMMAVYHHSHNHVHGEAAVHEHGEECTHG